MVTTASPKTPKTKPAGRAGAMDAFKAQMLQAVRRDDAPGRAATAAVTAPKPVEPATPEPVRAEVRPAADEVPEAAPRPSFADADDHAAKQAAPVVTALPPAPEPAADPEPEPAAAKPRRRAKKGGAAAAGKVAEPLPLIEQFTVSLDASELRQLTVIKTELQDRGIIGHKIADAWLMRLALRAWNPGDHDLAADVAAMRAADGRGKR